MSELPQTVRLPGGDVEIVDLSHPLGPSPSEPNSPAIRRSTHAEGAELWSWLYGIPRDALPEQGGLASEEVTASTHAGTHVDAPWHYGPVSAGRPSATIDQIPLTTCIGPLIVIDVRDLADGASIGVDELRERLGQLAVDLRPGQIIVLFTGAGESWGQDDFWHRGVGLTGDAVLWLVQSGVQLIGTDAWSIDRPYPLIGTEWSEAQDCSRLWPAHFAGTTCPYCHVEKLRNLDKVPSVGATMVAAPIAVVGGSAGWVRAFAFVPAERPA